MQDEIFGPILPVLEFENLENEQKVKLIIVTKSEIWYVKKCCCNTTWKVKGTI